MRKVHKILEKLYRQFSSNISCLAELLTKRLQHCNQTLHVLQQKTVIMKPYLVQQSLMSQTVNSTVIASKLKVVVK